jgi:hypothetical protein
MATTGCKQSQSWLYQREITAALRLAVQDYIYHSVKIRATPGRGAARVVPAILNWTQTSTVRRIDTTSPTSMRSALRTAVFNGTMYRPSLG